MRSAKIIPIIVITFFIASSFTYCQAEKRNVRVLLFFYSPECHSCAKVKKEVLPEIEKEFKDKIAIEYHNMDDIENVKLFLSLKEKYPSAIGSAPPVFYFEGHFLNGTNNLKENLKRLLESTPITSTHEKENLPNINLVKFFQSLTPFAIITVGLIDGINPCAVTVIVFFMSFLAFQGYRKREIAVVGLIFIGSVYVTYVLIGIGIFGFLYRLQGFWILTKIINITIGCISILFSGYALYDFMKFRKTKSTQDMLLHLPKSVQASIHKVIRQHYVTKDGSSNQEVKRPMFGLMISALVTGFLVSVLEAVCVVKIYLPTIVFVLKTTQYKVKALIYLLLYNLLFVLPLIIIFIFALKGTTSERFAALLKGHLGLVKILMAIMFLCLGIFLLWRA